MMSRDEWLERKKQWEIFNRWEAEQSLAERDAADNIADIGVVVTKAP